MISRLPLAVIAAALFVVAGAASQSALAQSAVLPPAEGDAKDQATNIREFTSNAITSTIISTIRRGYFKSIRKTFGFNFFPVGSLPPMERGERGLGMSAGDQESDISAWGNTGYRNYHSDAGGVSSKSNIYSGLVGMDFVVSERIIVGASTGYTTSRSRSDFTSVANINSASGTNLDSNATLDNWTIAGYGAALLTDNVFVDATAGMTFSEIRVNTLTDTNLVTESGDQDADTAFISLNVNYAKVFDKINVLAAVGYNYSINRADSFTSDQGTVLPGSDRANSFMTFGGEVGYQLNKFTPYALAALEIDLARNPRGGGDLLVGAPVAETDDSGARFGVGVDFVYADNIIGSFEVSKVIGKEGVVDTSGFLNVHITF